MTVVKMNSRAVESELLTVDLDTITTPPHRMLDKYPLREKRIAAHMATIANIGVLEGIIARRAGNKFELANGVEIVEAARRSHLKTVPLIVRSFTDEEGLKIQASEHHEDKNAEFLDNLCVWEATIEFAQDPARISQAIDIAKVLGWTRPDRDKQRPDPTATACDAAYTLVAEGHMTREDFRDMSVSSALEIAQRTRASFKKIEADAEKVAKLTQRPVKTAHVESLKKTVTKAAKKVAEGVRADDIKVKDIRVELDFKAYQELHDKKKELPLFAAFGKRLVDQLLAMLTKDAAAEKLAEVAKAAQIITRGEDLMIHRAIDFALSKVERAAQDWRKQIKRRGEEIEPFSTLKRRKEFQDLLPSE